jgi:hypothetical protein
MKMKFIAASLCTYGLSGAAIADQVIADDLIVTGNTCVGSSCIFNEVLTPVTR